LREEEWYFLIKHDTWRDRYSLVQNDTWRRVIFPCTKCYVNRSDISLYKMIREEEWYYLVQNDMWRDRYFLLQAQVKRVLTKASIEQNKTSYWGTDQNHEWEISIRCLISFDWVFEMSKSIFHFYSGYDTWSRVIFPYTKCYVKRVDVSLYNMIRWGINISLYKMTREGE